MANPGAAEGDRLRKKALETNRGVILEGDVVLEGVNFEPFQEGLIVNSDRQCVHRCDIMLS